MAKNNSAKSKDNNNKSKIKHVESNSDSSIPNAGELYGLMPRGRNEIEDKQRDTIRKLVTKAAKIGKNSITIDFHPSEKVFNELIEKGYRFDELGEFGGAPFEIYW